MHDAGRDVPQVQGFWVALLSSSLLAACLNVAVATLRRPDGHRDLAALLAFVSASFALFAIAQLAVFALAALTPIRRGLDRPALDFGVAIACLAIACIWPLLDLLPRTSPAETFAVGAAILCNVLLAPLLAYRLAAGASARLRALGGALALAAPLLGAFALTFVWLQVFRIEGPASPASLASAAVLVLASLAVVGAARALGSRARPLGWLLGLSGVAIAAPIVPLLAGGEGEVPPSSAVAGPLPYVLLLTVDTLRADALELDAAGTSRTPALAALARESIVFGSARSAGCWTKPSVASLLTGLSPLVHGVTEGLSRLPEEVKTLAESLREGGYTTAAIGHNAFLKASSNFDQGFGEYNIFPRAPGTSFGGRLLAAVSPFHFGASEPSTEDLTQMALEWIRDHRDRPFFLWLHYLDPHGPYAPDPHLLAGREPPPRLGQRFEEVGSVRAGRFVASAAEKSWIRGLYDAEVAQIDAGVGRVLATLRELGLYDRALIAFTSDHGEEFWEHGSAGHGHVLYDEVVRVPLLFKLPGGRVARRIEASVSTESLSPTLLDLLGLSQGAGPFTSESLATFATQGSPAPGASPQLSTATLYFENKTSLLFGDMKYIRAESGREELYDLASDPSERRPLTSPDRLREARARLDRYTESAAKLRRELALTDSRLEPDAQWREQLRALGYVE